MFMTSGVSTLSSIGQIICVLLIFIFVLFLAYVAARVAGSFQANGFNKGSNIKVIEVYRLSNSKLIEIVKIGDQYLALAVCKDTVTVLTTLTEDEIVKHESSLQPIDFKNILEKMKNEKNNKE